MTLKSVIAADVSVFFNTDECAEPARLWNGEIATDVTVIPGADEILAGASWPGGDAQGQSFLLQRAEAPNVSRGMQIELTDSGEFWTIQDFRPSDAQVWSVYCVKSHRARA